MTRFWFLRVHRDVCRQNEALHRAIVQLTAERDESRAANERLRDRVRTLEFDNWCLARFVPPQDRDCASGFVTTFREIADSDEIERKT